MSESIYNLVPDDSQQGSQSPARGGGSFKYTSIHAEKVREEAKKIKSPGNFYGPPGFQKPDPKSFTRKGQGESIRSTLREKKAAVAASTKELKQTVLVPATEPRLDEATLKYVPRKTERGMIAPRTQKDYVKENLKEAAKFSPKRTQNMSQAVKPAAKTGEVPAYIKARKEAAAQEAAMAATMQMQATKDPGLKKLSDAERDEILSGLRRNYKDVYSKYLNMSVVVDTISKRVEKNELEAKLAELEADIAKIERGNEIFVQM